MPHFSLLTRRALFRSVGFAAGAALSLPVKGADGGTAVAAHLDVKDAAAIAVGYTEDANRVDAKKYPAYVKGSTCENCSLLQGAEGSRYRPCNLFPGKLVAASGWCTGWSAEI